MRVDFHFHCGFDTGRGGSRRRESAEGVGGGESLAGGSRYSAERGGGRERERERKQSEISTVREWRWALAISGLDLDLITTSVPVPAFPLPTCLPARPPLIASPPLDPLFLRQFPRALLLPDYHVQNRPALMDGPLRSLLAREAASQAVCDRCRISAQQARSLQPRPACGSERREGR